MPLAGRFGSVNDLQIQQLVLEAAYVYALRNDRYQKPRHQIMCPFDTYL